MDDTEPENPRGATLVADAWRRFEREILPAAVEDPTPAVTDLARLSFYFGAFALFGILGAVLDGAQSEEAVDVARNTLAEEFDAFLANHEADLH
jgi:hypothetical protein